MLCILSRSRRLWGKESGAQTVESYCTAIGDCGQKVERGKDPDLRTGCGLSVVSVDGKKTRPGGNVADKQLPSSDLVALLYL